MSISRAKGLNLFSKFLTVAFTLKNAVQSSQRVTLNLASYWTQDCARRKAR